MASLYLEALAGICANILENIAKAAKYIGGICLLF
jgi:hypothetical protein